MKKLIKPIFNILGVLLAIIIIIFFLWDKLIRIRFPRDIPFMLTEIKGIFLFCLCCLYFFLIVNILIKKKSSRFLACIVDFIIFKPLSMFDYKIRNHPKLKNSIESISLKVITLLSNSNYYKIYFYFQVVPKIIILLTFIIDIFLFHKLNYFYKSLPLSLVIYIPFCIKYCLTNILEDQSKIVDESIDINYLEPPYKGTLISAKQYAYQKAMYSLHGSAKEPSCLMTMNITYIENRFKLLGLSFKTHKFNSQKIIEQRKSVLLLLEEITLILYKYSQITTKYNSKFSLLFYGLYLLCWSYILVVSLPFLPTNAFEWLWIIQESEEPFSLTNLRLTYAH